MAVKVFSRVCKKIRWVHVSRSEFKNCMHHLSFSFCHLSLHKYEKCLCAMYGCQFAFDLNLPLGLKLPQ